MSDRLNQDNSSDAVHEESRYKTLMERYETLLEQNSNWKIKFETTVIPNGEGYEVDVVASLGNGKGVRKTLGMDAVHYSINDKEGLARSLADQMLLNLLSKKAFEDLLTQLAPAMDNAVKMAGKR